MRDLLNRVWMLAASALARLGGARGGDVILDEADRELQTLAAGLAVSLAGARGLVRRLRARSAGLSQEESDARKGIRTCLNAGEREAALRLSERLVHVERERGMIGGEIRQAERVCAEISAFRNARLEALRGRIDGALDRLSAAERRRWHSRLALSFERAEVAGVAGDETAAATSERAADPERDARERLDRLAEERRQAEAKLAEFERAAGAVGSRSDS